MAGTHTRRKTKSARTISRKAVKRPQKRKGGEAPEDNPKLRYQQLSADYFAGTPKGISLASLRAAAVEDTRDMTPAHEAATTPATPGGSNWVQLGPLAVPNGQTYGGARVVVTGRVSALAAHPVDPNTIYVGAARGGIWKTTDAGVTWNPTSDNAASLAIGALAISRSNPQVLYAGTGEGNIYFYRINYPLNSINESYTGSGILKTSDGGITWNTQGASQFTGACFYRMAVHPSDPNTAMAASNLGLHRTTDGGATWVQLTNGLPAISGAVTAATDLLFDPSTPATAFAAFWGSGIYKTTNANAVNPSWTKLAGGLPTTSLGRISIAISPTAPLRLYALIANASDSLNGFYASSDGGATWAAIAVASGVVSLYGAYTANIAVDISTPDIVYLSGVSLYKAVKSGTTWSVTDVGGKFHPDNHAFASHPTNHLVIYAGSDGGAYMSSDGGTTWNDTFNEGLCIAQFEFIDQHPTSDAVIVGGTQDNGTEQFRNSPAFYHSADGDGGSAGIDHTTPRNVIHTYYGLSPERSTQGGAFASWAPIGSGLGGSALFYPPLAYDQTNSQNLAIGSSSVYLDSAQGTGGWLVNVALPGISGSVSALSYVNSNLIYACTTSGQVYRLAKSGSSWSASAIHSAPLPVGYWIWAISTLPGAVNTVVVVFAGFGIRHVWRGAVAAGGTSAVWTDISGTGANHVPDIPVNALCVDPSIANTFYVGTDIGVFRTIDGGVNWLQFSDGLPNVAVYDLSLHSATRLLRAATHGRGIWERKLDSTAMTNVDLYLRDHLMATSRILPAPAPVIATFDDPLQHVAIGDQLWWWMCADAKVDSPAAITHTYQMPVSAVDYLAFETKLAHTDPQRTVTNRVYVQVHNRGIQPATNVTVKILYADATPSLPNLPSDFWTAFPGNGTTTDWKPIGAPQTIPSISPTRPEILEWDWVPPASAAQHSCLLIVVDCPSDPIPSANKVFDIGQLITIEKRVGLKNLHLIDALAVPFWWSHLKIPATMGAKDVIRVIGPSSGWSIGLLAPKSVSPNLKSVGLTAAKLGKQQIVALQRDLQNKIELYDPAKFLTLAPKAQRVELSGFAKSKQQDLLLLFMPQKKTRGTVTVIAESGGKVIGGNSFILLPGTQKT
jgi:photosystem II stability/assembly factor-like uncharacterized protein